MIKIMKFLIKIKRWYLENCMDKDTLEYENYLYAIEKQEKELIRKNQ